MTYPAVVLFISFAVITLLLVKVVPVFQSIFAGMGKELPLLTQSLIDLSSFVTNNSLYIVGALIIAIVALMRFYQTDKGRYLFDRMILKPPVIGPLMRKVAIAKFTRTLSTMISSGVPILDGLEIVSRTAGNKIVEKALMETRKEHQRRKDDRRAAGCNLRVPAYGGPDDRRRRGDGVARLHAFQDRRLLR